MRGPSSNFQAGDNGNGGVGFRGPGETKVESDKRVIRERIQVLKKETANLVKKRAHSSESRTRLGLPLVALVGYTNAGKSTLLNRLSRAGVLAGNIVM